MNFLQNNIKCVVATYLWKLPISWWVSSTILPSCSCCDCSSNNCRLQCNYHKYCLCHNFIKHTISRCLLMIKTLSTLS